MSRFTTRRPSLALPHDWESVEDAASRCFAAARLSMRGLGYTPEDRMESAAQLLLHVLETAGLESAARCHCGAPAQWIATHSDTNGASADVAQCTPHARCADYRTPLMDRASGAVRRVSFSQLSGRAANLRRSLDRQRQRDAEDAALRAASDAFTPRMAEDRSPLTRGDAHSAARSALGSIGLARLGKTYPLAYAAVRAVSLAELGDGAPLATIARELGYASPDALRVILNRQRSRVPSLRAGYSMNAHLDAALLLDTDGLAMKPTRSRQLAADMESDWRTAPDTVGAVTSASSAQGRRKGGATTPLRLHAGTPQERRVEIPRNAPQWVRELWLSNPASAARLHRAAELKRARADAADAPAARSIDAERGESYLVH